MGVALAACIFFLPPLAKQAGEERPAAKGPMLWVKAEDLKGLASSNPIDTWPDASGHQHSLQAKGPARPTFRANALGTFPAVVFAGDPTSKASQFFDVPLQGEWPGVTVLAVGSKLTGSGWLDSAPGRLGCLRTLGPLQHTGTQAVLPTPFPALKDKNAFAQVSIVCGYDDAGVLHLSTFANGVPQHSTIDAGALFGVLFRQAHLGNINNGEHVFNGELVELLIYQGRLTEAERRATERYLLAKYHLGAQDADAPKAPIGVGSRLAKTAETIKQAEPHAKGTASRSRWAQQYPSLPHTMSWLGNSFSGKEVWVQNRVSDGCVLPDGTLATIHVWDEAGREGGLYKDGKVIGKLEGLPSAEYGHGGVAIATDGKYLYVGCSASDYRSFGIRRYTLNGKHAPWPGFKDREWLEVGARKERDISGLAAARGELFVAASWDDKVLVYDSATAKLKRAFTVPQPNRLAVDRGGKLWVSQQEGVVQYDTSGKPTGKKITGLEVGALAVDHHNRLLIADKGARQQILFFDISDPQSREIATLGEKGGIYAGRRGQMGEKRLLFPNGIGVDAAGNVYVTMSYPGGVDLRSFTPRGQPRWRLTCTDFTDCGNFDPVTDGADIYTGHEHYVHVPGQPPGRDWQWKDCTFDPLRFPDDPRNENNLPGNVTQTILRRLNGRLYLFGQGDPRYLSIYRQEEGSAIFVPCGLLLNDDRFDGPWPKTAPRKVRSFWCDRNGRGNIEPDEFTTAKSTVPPEQIWGWYVDSQGDIWQSLGRYGLRHVPLKGINEHGVPLYVLADEIILKRPVPFLEILRVEYFPESDTMYLAGTTYEHPSLGTEHFGCAGREVIRYDNWSKPSRKIRARMPIPEGATNIKAISVTPDGKRLFCGEMETMTLLSYDTGTGQLLGIVEPDTALVGHVGWIDIHNGIRAFARKNGETLLLCEEVWTQKELVYRLPPPKK